jgi:DNA polymerase epsilon subunit 1
MIQAEAYKCNIIFPNKQTQEFGKMWEGHVLESETYVGGHVEALESGIFRADFPTKFKLDTQVVESLLTDLDDILKYAMEVEGRLDPRHVTNYEEIKLNIENKLNNLLKVPKRKETCVIYHLDVAAMYPNIILTNR